MAGQAEVERKVRPRSPSYPGVDLETALDRARLVHQHEQRHKANIDTILGHWNYSPRSGPGLVLLAALKKFGLMVDEGSGQDRQAGLSDLALDILLDERDNSPERSAAIKKAALAPPIHSDLWEKYGGRLPSDQNLRFHLIRERAFTDSGADEFIAQFRRTISFARLGEDGTISTPHGDKIREGKEVEMLASPTAAVIASKPAVNTPPAQKRMNDKGVGVDRVSAEVRKLTFPLIGGGMAILEAPLPMSEENYKLVITMLNTMQPAITYKPPEGSA